MAKTYITTATTTQVHTGFTPKVLIQNNIALTGTITVIDGTAGTTANVAVITNPAVGNIFEYWDFKDGVRIVTSATSNITVSIEAGRGH